MSLFKVFNVSGSAVSAQSQRLNVYKARQVVFQTQMIDGEQTAAGVRVAQVAEDNAAPRRIHDPSHPLADEQGFVTMSNVNVVEEMVNMISASRSYQTNIDVMNTAKTLLQKTLQLGT
jgi:flagellar basal-body rod protein FlgC